MLKKITKEEYPEEWEFFIEEEEYDLTEKEHRRGSTFYVCLRYKIDDPDYPELQGMWESDDILWSDGWGLEEQPKVLYRLEEKEKIVKYWERIK